MCSQVNLQLHKLMVDIASIVLDRAFFWFLEHGREEALDDSCSNLCLLSCIETAFQNKHIRDSQEDLSVAALNLLLEFGIFFASAFDKLTETDKLLSLIPRD